jgi:hypothetical protein
MLGRCYNPKTKGFHRYGGRGITVCEEWRKFAAFYRDMGPRPSPQHSLERRDNDGPYTKDNCKWATKSEQSYNQKRHYTVKVGQVAYPLPPPVRESVRALGISRTTLRDRLLRGWALDRATTTPINIARTPRATRHRYQLTLFPGVVTCNEHAAL